jgi:hypothetical protein
VPRQAITEATQGQLDELQSELSELLSENVEVLNVGAALRKLLTRAEPAKVEFRDAQLRTMANVRWLAIDIDLEFSTHENGQ